MKGKVKFFNKHKGYGFILGEDNHEYFVHISDVSGSQTLNENDQVSFDVSETGKGKQAKNVIVSLSDSNKPAEHSNEPAEQGSVSDRQRSEASAKVLNQSDSNEPAEHSSKQSEQESSEQRESENL